MTRTFRYLAVAEPHVEPAVLSFPEIPGFTVEAADPIDAAADAGPRLQRRIDRMILRGEPIPSPSPGLSALPPFDRMIRFAIAVGVPDGVRTAPPVVERLFPLAQAI